jgi:hypothetical protein
MTIMGATSASKKVTYSRPRLSSVAEKIKARKGATIIVPRTHFSKSNHSFAKLVLNLSILKLYNDCNPITTTSEVVYPRKSVGLGLAALPA